jgi:hypothetical protein
MFHGGIFCLIVLKRSGISCNKLKLQMSIPDIFSNSYRRRIKRDLLHTLENTTKGYKASWEYKIENGILGKNIGRT